MARSQITQSKTRMSQGQGSQRTQSVRARASDFDTSSRAATGHLMQGMGKLQNGVKAIMNEAESRQQKKFKIEQSIWLNREAVDSSMYWDEKVKSGDVPEDFDKFSGEFHSWQEGRLEGLDDDTKARFISQTEPMRRRVFVQHQNAVAASKTQDAASTNSGVLAGVTSMLYGATSPSEVDTVLEQTDSILENMPTVENQAAIADLKGEAEIRKIELTPESGKAKAIEDSSLSDDAKSMYMSKLEQAQTITATAAKSRSDTLAYGLVDGMLNLDAPLPSEETLTLAFNQIRIGMANKNGRTAPRLRNLKQILKPPHRQG